MKIALLLTSTVCPQVATGKFSESERMEMYHSTLQYYADTIGCDYPVVLVENSDADLTVWKEEFKESLRLEILQFVPLELQNSQRNREDYGFDNRKGKGYNEYLMIKLALERSESLKECTHFLKITGRYPMLNIREMLGEMEKRGKDKVMMCDVKDSRLYEILWGTSYGSHWGDSRFFLVAVDFYKEQLMDCYQEMDDRVYGKFAENYLYGVSRKYRKDDRFSFRFRHQVQFGGQSEGALQDVLYISFRDIVKNKLRSVLRALFPHFWF